MVRVCLMVLLACSAGLGGCMTAAKETFYAVRGAQGKVIEVDPVGSLGKYDGFRVEAFQNGIGSVLPAEMPALIQNKIRQRLVEETFLTDGGKRALTLRGKIVFIDVKGLGSGMISPMEEVVCHIELMNPAGKVLGWAVIAGRSQSRVRGGIDGEREIADGVSKGVVHWLVQNGIVKKEKE